MKSFLILSVTLLTLALSPALSNAMCIYSEGPDRTNPNNGDTLDTLYVSFSAGLFHHYYTWQMNVGDSMTTIA